jgi:hypothetical protein
MTDFVIEYRLHQIVATLDVRVQELQNNGTDSERNARGSGSGSRQHRPWVRYTGADDLAHSAGDTRGYEDQHSYTFADNKPLDFTHQTSETMNQLAAGEVWVACCP